MADPIQRVLESLPAPFFEQLQEYADAGFAEALTLVGRHVEEPEHANMLGQLRHARCEAGFRRAARENGITVYSPHTDPAGGRYSIVSAGAVFLIRSNIQPHCGPPRATVFRKEWSALNAWLDPVQLDLLRSVPAPAANRLCGMIVITAHPRRGDPSVPAFIGLGIPRADLSGWAVPVLPLTALSALYHDADTRVRTPREAAVEVKDRVVPRIKKQPDVG
jgi:hypothetical protein